MSRDSVLPDMLFSVEELKALGRERLVSLQNEAARRLSNQRRVYGPTYRPGRQRALQDTLQTDIKRIRAALLEMDREEGAAYRVGNPPGSRQEIAENLVHARREALLNRNDEGVPAEVSRAAAQGLAAAKKAARELADLGHPLTAEDEQAAKARIIDRRRRMSDGVRRQDPQSVCPNCRNAILADTPFCAHCGKSVATRTGRRVFLSHAWEEKDWVNRLHGHLAKHGLRPWIDERELTAGAVLDEALTQEIRGVDVFVFVASRASIAKDWPLQELAVAARRVEEPEPPYRIVPLLLTPGLSDLPPVLASRLGVQAYDADGRVAFGTDAGDAMLDRLVRAINDGPGGD